MPKPLTISAKLDRFPPIIIRLLARHSPPNARGLAIRALLDSEIAARSDLAIGHVRHLSRQTSWDHVEVGTMLAFLRGCGADLDSRTWLRKNSDYMRSIRSHPAYLRRSPEWSTTFEPLIGICAKLAP